MDRNPRLKIRRGWSVQCALALLIVHATSQADTLSLAAGWLEEQPGDGDSYAWSVDYRQPLAPYVSAGFAWVNEGHVPANYRDGPALFLWTGRSAADQGLAASLGLGIYRYFDTAAANSVDGFDDIHGWGTIASGELRWHSSTPWFVQLRVNRILTRNGLDTTAVLAGAGYRFAHVARSESSPRSPRPSGSTLTASLGQTIANTFAAESGLASSIEYRRNLLPMIDLSLAGLYEHDEDLVRRFGISAQIWAMRSIPNSRVEIGAGAGAYLAILHRSTDAGRSVSDGTVSVLLSIGLRYHLSNSVFARLTWNRISSTYNRDSDMLLIGLGIDL